MKNTKVDPVQTAAKELKAEVAKMTPIERGKALKAAVTEVKGKSGVEGGIIAPATAKPVVKEVIPFGQRAKIIEKPAETQTAYEQRYYMRQYHGEKVDENTVTHLTSHTTGQLQEVTLPEIQKMYAERKADMPERDIFTARHLIDHFNIFGPAQGDICRATFRKLVKAGKMKEEIVQLGRTHRLKYRLLELVPPTEPPKVVQK